MLLTCQIVRYSIRFRKIAQMLLCDRQKGEKIRESSSTTTTTTIALATN